MTIRVHLSNGSSREFPNGWSFDIRADFVEVLTSKDVIVAKFFPGQVSWVEDLNPEDE